MDWPSVWAQRGGWSLLLLPLSWLYALGWRIYLLWYRFGFKRACKPDIPIVGVGSITVGGSGKTPLTIALAKLFMAQGLRPAISCNGYGGDGRLRVLDPEEVATPAEVGDEAVEIREALPAVPIVVGRKRLEAARLIARRQDVDVLLLDDGFQHLPLARDRDIVVVDGERPFGNGRCLPSGPLREPRSGLSRAHTVVRMGLDAIRQPEGLRPLSGGDDLGLEWLRDRDVVALSALGDPARFERSLADLGARVTPARFPDHYHYTTANIAPLVRPIVTTRKDAVKLRGLGNTEGIYVLSEQVVFPDEPINISFLLRKPT